jgi:hypothetical protein
VPDVVCRERLRQQALEGSHAVHFDQYPAEIKEYYPVFV